MPITLSQALIDEKNKVESTGAWLILIKLTPPNPIVTPTETVANLHLVHNNEDVVINSQTYTAFPFTLDEITETSTGSLPSFNLKVSNIDRVIQQYIELDETYGSGWSVLVSVVSSNQIEPVATQTPAIPVVPEMEFDATSLSVSCDREWCIISCGVANPMMQQFPKQKYATGFCQRTFKDGVGCPYVNNYNIAVDENGDAVSTSQVDIDPFHNKCSKTLDACKAKFPLNAQGFHRGTTADTNLGLPYLAFNGIPSRAIY